MNIKHRLYCLAYCLTVDKISNTSYNMYFEKQVCFPNQVLLYNIQWHCNKTIPKEELTTEGYWQESTIINSTEGRLLSWGAQQNFAANVQTANLLGFGGHWYVLQLLNSATVAWQESQTTGIWISVAVSLWYLIFKNKRRWGFDLWVILG